MRARSAACAWALTAALAVAHALGSPANHRRASLPNVRIDLVLHGDLAGDGRSLTVKWYRRGPFRMPPPSPPGYVRGVAIRDPNVPSSVLGRWESQRTTIPDSNEGLNGLWPLRDTRGLLITALVQYGGTTYVLNALRFDRRHLKLVRVVGGRGVWVRKMGSAERPVLVVRPSDEFALRQIYALDSPSLARADRDFPAFWRGEVASYAGQIADMQPEWPPYLARFCELACEAAQLARRPNLARRPCIDARQRILSGQSYKGDETPQQRAQLRQQALSRIEKVLSGGFRADSGAP